MQLAPYLNFDGTCAEAFRFYGEVFGGRPEIMRPEEMPDGGGMGPEWRGRVMHASLDIGGQQLMGSDSPPGGHEGMRGMHVSVHVEDVEEGRRLFDRLQEGGSVTMPFEQTFWSPGFGMLVDRFGTPWMVNTGG
jgi:PhnB protein